MLTFSCSPGQRNSKIIAVFLHLISLTPVLSVQDEFAVINIHKYEFSSGQPQLSGKDNRNVNMRDDGENVLLRHIKGRFSTIGKTAKANGRLHMVWFID